MFVANTDLNSLTHPQTTLFVPQGLFPGPRAASEGAPETSGGRSGSREPARSYVIGAVSEKQSEKNQ